MSLIKVKNKTGELVYKYNTSNKAETYNESKKVIGFKIDIRFTVRTDGKNFDFGCGEVAVYDNDAKIIEDEGSLFCEAKEQVIHTTTLKIVHTKSNSLLLLLFERLI
jgi:hypothetical protein